MLLSGILALLLAIIGIVIHIWILANLFHRSLNRRTWAGAGMLFWTPVLVQLWANGDGPGTVFMGLVVLVLGPTLGALSIGVWAKDAGWIGWVAIAIGVVAGVIAALWLKQRRSRASGAAAFGGVITFGASGYLASEIIVSVALAATAQAQFPNGYADFDRAPVFQMMQLGQSDFVSRWHATLRANGQDYHWSFSSGCWEKNNADGLSLGAFGYGCPSG